MTAILEKENRALRERIEFLEEQVAQLKEMIFPTSWQAPRELKFTRHEAIVVETLYHNEGVVTKKKLLDALYYFRSDGDVPIGNCLQVFMSRIRTKLQPYGATVNTVRSLGYELSPESRDILKNIGYVREVPVVKEDALV